MKHLIAITLFILIPILGFANEKSLNAEDSLLIRINYYDVHGCVHQKHGTIKITVVGDGASIVHMNWDRTLQVYTINSDGIMDKIKTFEKIATEEKRDCGGFEGGMGVYVELIIGEHSSDFKYCKDEWDGIDELLKSLTSPSG